MPGVKLYCETVNKTRSVCSQNQGFGKDWNKTNNYNYMNVKREFIGWYESTS